MNKVVAIVQARMGSVRFPGKMLASLGGYPILDWVLLRLKQAKQIDEIVLATSDLSRDDPLVVRANSLGVSVYRGSEQDVLQRFRNAAQVVQAETIVRVCADNPFVDAQEVDRLVEFYQDFEYDYACNHQNRINSGYADGFGAEILGSALLFDIEEKAIDTLHREHVTLYLWDHASSYKMAAPLAPPELAYPDYRFDVDSLLDLERLERLVGTGLTLGSSAAEIISAYRLGQK
jgi:spore coat polysaccharide biosynthesis protein SpsF